VVEEGTEGLEADLPLPDMLVPIQPRPEPLLGVVQVEGAEPVQANQPVEGLERGCEPFLAADIVAGREEVAGVEAEAEALGLPHPLQDPAQLLEPGADQVPRPRRVLEDDPDPEALGPAVKVIDGGGDPLEAGVEPRPLVRARMDDDEGEPEGLGPE